MGIRFRCHHCEHELNLKEFQAGRRARCPSCSGRFRVPTASADFSDPLDDQEAQLATANVLTNQATSATGTFNLRPSSSDPDIVASRIAAHGSVERAPSSPASVPEAITEAPQAVWYVRPPSGGQYGPAEGHVFHNWLKDNRVSADSLVWRDGWPQWQMAGNVFTETFGVNWQVAQDAAEGDALIDDDTIDGPIDDSPLANSHLANKDADAPVISPIAVNRRRKKQATYGIFIGILALLALVLIGVLLSVVL